MKIIILRSNPVSPDSRVEKEAYSLINSGFDVSIIGLDRSKSYEWKRESISIGEKSVDIFRIGIPSSFGGGIKNLIPMIKFNRKLYKWLKKNRNKFDCIHGCDLDTGYTAMKISKKYKIPFVYDIFDYYPASHSFPSIIKKIVVNMEKKVINNSRCVIICSEKRKEQISHTNPRKIVVLHNSPSQTVFRDSNTSFVIHNQESNKIKIGYVGILSKSRLLQEMVEVVQNRQDLELHIGGFGQLETYMIEKSQVHNNIFYYGKLSYDVTLQLENKMDILTAIYDPSVENHRFAAPNKFYESLMLGKPLIMVHNTGFDDVIKMYNLGTLIDFSAEGFEKGINDLLSNKDQWITMSNNGHCLFETSFSWEIMEKRLVNIYSDLSKEICK